jgi:serine/threonine protein kinase
MGESRDDVVARLAVDRGFATDEEVATARDVQKKAFDVGLPQSLDQVLCARGVLNPDTLQELSSAVAVATGEARIVAGYEVVQKLGQGGMGAVYKARRQSTGEFVALKILPPSLADDETIARFRREGEIVSALHHDNIVGWIEFGYDSKRNCHFCALEYIDGTNVTARIRDKGTIPEAQTIRIVRQIACALDHASSIGLVHRDVKPENIMVTSEGRALLLDLGLARAVRTESTRLTQTGIFVGTVHYCSPEQAKGESELDVRSDIYALGASMYHMITGHPPFGGDSALVIIRKHIEEKLRWPTGSGHGPSDGVRRVVGKMMAKRPEDRYQTPSALIRDLDLLLEGKEPEIPDLATHKRRVALRRTKAHPTASASRGRGLMNAPMLTALSVAAGALVLAGILFFRSLESPPNEKQVVADSAASETTAASATGVAPARPESPPFVPESTPTAARPAPRPAPADAPRTAAAPDAEPDDAPHEAATALPYTDDGPDLLDLDPRDALANIHERRAAEDALRTVDELLATIALVVRDHADAFPVPEMARLSGEAAMTSVLEELVALHAVVRSLEARRSAIRESVQDAVGSKISLRTVTGTQTGTVVETTESGILLDVAIAPGGTVIGNARTTIPWGSLSPIEEEGLAGEWQPRDADSQIALAIIALAEKNIPAAKEALAAAGEGHPLATLVGDRIHALSTSQCESAAVAAWEKIEKRTTGTMTAKDARALLQRISSFEEKHADTTFLVSASERLNAARARCEGAIPKQPRTRVALWDEFEDTDATQQTWTQWAGSWGIAEGCYYQTRTMDDQIAVAGDTAWADYSVETRLRMGGKHDQGTGLVFRAADPDNYYLFEVQTNAANAKIQRRADGRLLTIAADNAPSGLRPWQWYTIRVDVRGASIRAFVDDDLAVECIDPTHKTGMIGLNACAGAWFEYVKVTLSE